MSSTQVIQSESFVRIFFLKNKTFSFNILGSRHCMTSFKYLFERKKRPDLSYWFLPNSNNRRFGSFPKYQLIFRVDSKTLYDILVEKLELYKNLSKTLITDRKIRLIFRKLIDPSTTTIRQKPGTKNLE